MSSHNKDLGRYGEQLAVEYLQRHECQIVATNVRTPCGEIDIIADDGRELVFCEVKTRSNTRYGYPEQAVDYRKQSHMIAAAQSYIEQTSQERFWRVDIISILVDRSQKKAHIHWFKNISSD